MMLTLLAVHIDLSGLGALVAMLDGPGKPLDSLVVLLLLTVMVRR
jgi:hypothetical protein